MNEKPKKLMSWGQFWFAMSAVAVGSSLSLIREYHDSGSVSGPSILISAITFCIGTAIMVWYFRRANRPEPELKEEDKQ